MNAAARRNPPNDARSSTARWFPAVAAAALLGTVIVAGVAGGSGNGGGGSSPSTSPEPTDASDVSLESFVVPETTPPPPVETVPEVEKVPLTRTLTNGVAGDDVQRVQERLTELGFNPGGTDGVYGPLTIQSVWAYEKIVMQVPREQVTGRVTPEMWDDMQDHVRVAPRRPNPGTPNHTEVYLPEQVLAVFHGGEAVFVAHMSHGTGDEWCREVTISPGEYGNERGEEPLKVGRCGISNTPGGVFTYHRMVEGQRQSALGGMLNPVYFNYGIAIHGAQNVPNHPASHGCIRIPNALSEHYQSLVSIGERVFVFDGVKQPEDYGEQLPTFDWPDPDYSTTTTSTSTTTTSTTVAPTTVPETTVPAATTTEVATTTTTSSLPEATTPDTTPDTTLNPPVPDE